MQPDNLRQVIVHNQGVLLDHLLVCISIFVQTIARVLDCYHMHLKPLSNQIQQIKCQADVFCISVEVHNNLVGAFIERQEQAGDMVLHLVCLLHLDAAWDDLVFLLLRNLALVLLHEFLYFLLDLVFLLVSFNYKLINIFKVQLVLRVAANVLVHIDCLVLAFFQMVHCYFLTIRHSVGRSNDSS